MMNKKTILSLMTGTMLALSASAHAADNTMAEDMTEPLSSMQDQSAITLTGTIKSVSDDEFVLDYGGADNITVELDRFGWTGNETRYLNPGESVTVNGFIDDDLFEGREIEAYNISLNDSYVYYYTAETDPVYTYTYTTRPADGTFVTMTGTVTDIEGGEFTITNDNGSMRVNPENLGYDPYDNEGLQRIELNDVVYVYGQIDDGFFESREIVAESIVELLPADDRPAG